MKQRILLLISALFIGSISAQNPSHIDTAGVNVYFKQGHSELDPSFRSNSEKLESFALKIAELRQDSSARFQSILIKTYSSPEGSSAWNKKLSDKRAATISDYLRQLVAIPESQIEINSLGVDWQGLGELVEASEMPYRSGVLDILHNTPIWVIRKGKVVDSRKRQLQLLHGGDAWWYMSEHLFPNLRGAAVQVIAQFEPVVQKEPIVDLTPEPVPIVLPEPEPVIDTLTPQERPRKPFYMAMKTNMLFDAALVPNIGAEFYVGKGWSVGANWMYAWWWSNKQHNYWRIYGGELDVRKYFGERARQKPLTGHHLGLYGQMLTYDFETGSTGYLSKLSYGAGIEYGYSLPIGRRLNIDFGIGIGYLGGEYKVYDPQDGCYVWKETKQRRWFGPTKAEISLVWLIGHGNVNEKKGGK